MNNVIPNITINGERMKATDYEQLVYYCGAVAVSHYDDDTCYGAVKELSDRGMKQVNIHQLLSGETYDQCRRILIDSRHDKRLLNLNAIVFLMLKPKGNRNTYHQINREAYQDLVNEAINKNTRIGFDSCSASAFLQSVKTHDRFEEFKIMSEPCESTLFSYYINVDGVGFPCSFTENTSDYSGVDVIGCEDFMKDVWNAEETIEFRTRVMANKDCNGCRMCPVYKLNLD